MSHAQCLSVDFGELRGLSAVAARMDLEAGSVAVVHDPEFEFSYTVGLSDGEGMAELVLRGGTPGWRRYMLLRVAASVERNYKSLNGALVIPLRDGDEQSWFFRLRPARRGSFPVIGLYGRGPLVMELVPWDADDPANVDRSAALRAIKEQSVHVVAAAGYSYTVGMTGHGLTELVRPWGAGTPGEADEMLRQCALRSMDRGAVPGVGFPQQWHWKRPRVIPTLLEDASSVPVAEDLYGDFVQVLRMDDFRVS